MLAIVSNSPTAASNTATGNQRPTSVKEPTMAEAIEQLNENESKAVEVV